MLFYVVFYIFKVFFCKLVAEVFKMEEYISGRAYILTR